MKSEKEKEKYVWDLFSTLYKTDDKEEQNKIINLINSLKEIEKDKRLLDFIKSEENTYYYLIDRMKRGIYG